MSITENNAEAWNLSAEERSAIVDRAASGISNMSFFSDRAVDDDVAAETAKAIERKAYTRALVESRTTTGVRPKCVSSQRLCPVRLHRTAY
jgi:WPP domain